MINFQQTSRYFGSNVTLERSKYTQKRKSSIVDIKKFQICLFMLFTYLHLCKILIFYTLINILHTVFLIEFLYCIKKTFLMNLDLFDQLHVFSMNLL